MFAVVALCEIAFDYSGSLHFIMAATTLYSTLKTQTASTFVRRGILPLIAISVFPLKSYWFYVLEVFYGCFSGSVMKFFAITSALSTLVNN